MSKNIKQITEAEEIKIQQLISKYNNYRRTGKGEEIKQPLVEELTYICKEYKCIYCIHQNKTTGIIDKISFNAKEQ